MIFFLLFLAEFLALLLLSGFFTRALTSCAYKISGSKSFTISVLAIFFLPGTIVHELAHLFTAGILFVPVGELEVVPEFNGEKVKLGSVKIGQTDPLRRLLIGTAPVFLGLGLIFSILTFAPNPFSLHTPIWQSVIILYLFFAVTNTMFSSKKDLEGAAAFLAAGFVVLGLVYLILSFTGNTPSLAWLKGVDFSAVTSFFRKLDLFLLIGIVLNASLGGLLYILGRR